MLSFAESIYSFALTSPSFIAYTQVLLISSLPTFLLLFFPASIDSSSGLTLSLAKALSAGGLIGDCFLHSLPEAEGEHTGLAVIAGYVVFLGLDLLLKDSSNHSHSHGHGHGHNASSDSTIDYEEDSDAGDADSEIDPLLDVLQSVDDMILTSVDVEVRYEPLSTLPQKDHVGKSVVTEEGGEVYTVVASKGGWVSIQSDDSSSSAPSKSRAKNLLMMIPVPVPSASPSSSSSSGRAAAATDPRPRANLTSTALLSILGDVLHNVTDGLAIGVATATSPSPLTLKSLLTPLSIMLHEVPHELGDFAVLISCGYSKRRAIATQFLTAGGAVAGCGMGLMAVDFFENEASRLLQPFVAGGFVYLSSVLVSEVVRDRGSRSEGVLLLCAFLVGVGCLFWLTLMDGEGHGHSHGHSNDHHSHHHHDEHDHGSDSHDHGGADDHGHGGYEHEHEHEHGQHGHGHGHDHGHHDEH
mmetsp:Transcript_27788/g.55543  ORF Transcript_27788/g.55543 Transcript_27788/m.55543 type:complete len:469 (-) Transcript_27788:69-1475(-)